MARHHLLRRRIRIGQGSPPRRSFRCKSSDPHVAAWRQQINPADGPTVAPEKRTAHHGLYSPQITLTSHTNLLRNLRKIWWHHPM